MIALENFSSTMSLTSGTVNNPAIDSLVQSSLESENEYLRLKWIPYDEITDIKSTQIDNVYYSGYWMLLCLGNEKECTPALVSEFAKVYSLPTHEYKNDANQF